MPLQQVPPSPPREENLVPEAGTEEVHIPEPVAQVQHEKVDIVGE